MDGTRGVQLSQGAGGLVLTVICSRTGCWCQPWTACWAEARELDIRLLFVLVERCTPIAPPALLPLPLCSARFVGDGCEAPK